MLNAHPLSQKLKGWPQPLARDVIREQVQNEVAAYMGRQRDKGALQLLDPLEMERCIMAGKVKFGGDDDLPSAVDLPEALRAVEEAFLDGVVLMFLDGKKVLRLDEPLIFSEGSEVRYVRLAAFRGC